MTESMLADTQYYLPVETSYGFLYGRDAIFLDAVTFEYQEISLGVESLIQVCYDFLPNGHTTQPRHQHALEAVGPTR